MTEDAVPYVLNPAEELSEQVQADVAAKPRQRFRPTTREAEERLSALQEKAERFRFQRDRLRKHVPFAYLVGLSLGTLLGMSLR